LTHCHTEYNIIAESEKLPNCGRLQDGKQWASDAFPRSPFSRQPSRRIIVLEVGLVKKRLFTFIAAAIVLAFVFAPGVHADTITGITLKGGDMGMVSWYWDGQGWTTNATGWYVLGVSETPGGALINHADTTISAAFPGSYWLYADATYLGSAPMIEVTTAELGTLSAVFALSGSAGTETSWALIEGSTLLHLGFAAGSADQVGTYGQMTPNGRGDHYLHLAVGTPVPVPAALLLLAPGLAGLAAVRRRFTK
jgi:hypothetical protein